MKLFTSTAVFLTVVVIISLFCGETLSNKCCYDKKNHCVHASKSNCRVCSGC